MLRKTQDILVRSRRWVLRQRSLAKVSYTKLRGLLLYFLIIFFSTVLSHFSRERKEYYSNEEETVSCYCMPLKYHTSILTTCIHKCKRIPPIVASVLCIQDTYARAGSSLEKVNPPHSFLTNRQQNICQSIFSSCCIVGLGDNVFDRFPERRYFIVRV